MTAVLIDSENYQPEFNDNHEEPNVDLMGILFCGQKLTLPSVFTEESPTPNSSAAMSQTT